MIHHLSIAAREAWIERERAVNQRHHRADVLTEERQGKRGISQDPRVIPSNLQSPPSENGGLAFVLHRIFTRAVHIEASAANGSQGKSRPIIWIALDRLLKKTECPSGLWTC